MTATTLAPPRIATLDVLRGVAVMGILAMNIVGFGMPEQAYVNPAAYGGTTGADLWAWILSFIFVDGKMRGLFSLLFGASMLLVIERAQAGGESGGKVHVRRMLWLLLFGLVHYFLIWDGDILTLYALAGLVALAFAAKDERKLFRLALIFFGIGLVVYLFTFCSGLMLKVAASAPGADPQVAEQWASVKAELGAPAGEKLARDLALYRGSYSGILEHQLGRWYGPLALLLMHGVETLAFMLLGMWGLKSGFMRGTWEAARYRKVALICLAIGIPAFALLAFATMRTGFEPAATMALNGFVGAIFRPIMVIGYAALVLLMLKRGANGALTRRIGAAGRAAFTNYLGTSIIVTGIFYGWGLGLYGTLGRAELYLVVLGVWALMLLWSKPWLDRYSYGPLEWLWRTLARWERQPLRKPLPA